MIKNDDLVFLERVVSLSYDEWSETAQLLMDLWQRRDYVSDDTSLAIEKELQSQIDYVKENAEIVERDETHTMKTIDVEWKD